VSRALTNHPHVKETTRKKILDVAGRLEYHKNNLAIGLVGKRTGTIGILVPEIISRFYPSVISGIEQYIKEKKYRSIICQSGESYEQEVENISLMLSHKVDGIIASHTMETRSFDHFKAVVNRGVPLVMFNRTTDQLNVSTVVVDDYEGAFRMVDFLLKSGRKRIAHLSGPSSLQNSRLRLKGYLDALAHNNVSVDEQLILSYDLHLEKVKIYVKHFLDLVPRPDALFCMNDPTAIAAMQAIKQRGLSIPKDIAIAGFSNDLSSSLISPTLTTVAQPTQEMGREAARLLLAEILPPKKKQQKVQRQESVVLKTSLLFRESTDI
jgi:LacI family transcriptional regulator/LacI family repressor for deo operon, udp, cdd, tsx, nupC, and nupG